MPRPNGIIFNCEGCTQTAVPVDGAQNCWSTDRRLVLLNVHLKSGSPEDRLQPAPRDACATLAKQRKPLREWVDDHVKTGVPFIILGDFNRAFDKHGAADQLWWALHDGDSPEGELWRLPSMKESDC